MNNILIGKTIKDIKIAEDKLALLFLLEEGELIAKADADCCSYTWIEDVNNLATFPAKVTNVEALELNSDLPTNGGEMAYYGCKISTDKGDIVIDYRNESNGYYGGSLVWPVVEGEYYHFYGGVDGQNISKMQWRDLGAK